MRRLPSSLLRDARGAVAPTVALSLVGLIATGGLAYDYTRMAAMDTELQGAADQAALAAATQLDGKPGACSRAANAATSLVANYAVFANDGGSANVSVPLETTCDAADNVRFYQDKAKTIAATSDANANFVQVAVTSRTATYALTPIVALLNSGGMGGKAFAGLQKNICNVPPVMVCNPVEPAGNTNVDYPFDVNALTGTGLRLIGNNSYAPGNFGFLDTGFGNGANNLLAAMGWNTPPGTCVSTSSVSTKPGLNSSVIDGLNTRFDIDAKGNTCPAGGTCSPSINVRKDLARGSGCGITGNGWMESNGQRYRPTTAAPITSAYPAFMGLPRDMCHAVSITGTCAGGLVGDGNWDRAAYFNVNYPGLDWATKVASVLDPGQPASSITRYQVYKWEMTSPDSNIGTPQPAPGGKQAYGAPVCLAPGLTPGATTVDRRRLSVAVINCQAQHINGNATGVAVSRVADVFLVEPSYNRTRCAGGGGCNTVITNNNDIYVEVIGETTLAGDSGQAQLVARSTPYLIE